MSRYKSTFTLNISITVKKFNTYEKTIEFKNSDPFLDYEAKKSLVNKRLLDHLNEDIVKTIREFFSGAGNNKLQCTFKFNDENYVCHGENAEICTDSYLKLSDYMYKQSKNFEINCIYKQANNYMDMDIPGSRSIYTYLGDDFIS